ncbi:hypothetical protein AA0313_1284 [Acetobacter indonesiensis NRIC 0313]|nr:hypothetical protein AA0313_1284 [Acetobacter indonesiensis NRIC 0313]
MLSFLEQHIHQIPFNAGLDRHVGNRHHRAKFGQDNRHLTCFDNLNRNRLNISTTSGPRSLLLCGVAMTMFARPRILTTMRAQECKCQHAHTGNGNAAPDQTFFSG